MNNYVPFLKFKSNEIGALATLAPDLQAKTFPFLDLPKKEGMNEGAFLQLVAKTERAYKTHLKSFPAFFLDNFDIDDTIKVGGQENYSAVIDKFGVYQKFIPVIGLDRPEARNELIFQAKADGRISSQNIAIRLQYEDFQSFGAIEEDLKNLQIRGGGLFDYWTMVLDNRVCINIDTDQRSNLIKRFLQHATAKLKIHAVILAGSSFPASISEVMKVNSEINHPRQELSVYRSVFQAALHPSVHLGDYTIVSPLYSDATIPAEAMQNVIAAKTIYTHGDVHYVARGGALKTHSSGRLQYNDIAAKIIAQPFYRGANYSHGDNFLHQKAQMQGSGVTPGSILKPTINAHITYMLRDFPG